MCLLTSQKEPFIAEQDITVYKSLIPRRSGEQEIKYVSSCEYFPYIFNKLYSTSFTYGDKTDCLLDYQANIEALSVDENWRDKLEKDFLLLRQGFHSSKIKERLELFEGEVYVECTIPKGSKYFEDLSSFLVVSDQIIINQVLDVFTYETEESL